MITKLLIASNNKHKVYEFKKIFSKYNVEIITLQEANIYCDPEEKESSFKENALIKARVISEYTDLPIISDDSGLEIHALNGFPGVMSARFMEGRPYEEKYIEILKMMKDKKDKSANFKTVLCLYNLEKDPLFFEGIVEGEIVSSKGDNGFGYDPIFYSCDLHKTFGQAEDEEKNSVSHRGRAIEKMIEYLKENKYIGR